MTNPYSASQEGWLKRMATARQQGARTLHIRNQSHRIKTPASNSLTGDLTEGYEVQPRILESRISDSENFMRLSDGFKRCFSQDKKD